MRQVINNTNIMKKMFFNVNNEKVCVYIKQTPKHRKRVYLKIKDMKIYCLVPKYWRKKHVKEFIKKYITSFYEIVKQQKEKQPYSLVDNFLIIKGKKFTIRRVSPSSINGVSEDIQNNILYIKTLDSSDNLVHNTIKNYFFEKSMKYLKVRVKYWELKMKTIRHTIEFCKKKLWGRNNIDKHILEFNVNLFHFPKNVIDYLIIHELTHTKLLKNTLHNKEFWSVVKKYLPDYVHIRRELKAYSYWNIWN